MQTAIEVDNLSKCFRIGHERKKGYRTLRESVIETLIKPLRQLRAGNALGDAEDFWALRDVSFAVQPGEVIGIVGRNGSGKSTLLKILSGITPPSRGRVNLRGRVGSLLEVGTGFHLELTGRENVFLNGSILGMSHREITQKFDEIVAFSGVEKFLDTPVKRYSSGMRVRLAFAVAAHLEPEIILVDEVLAVGDAEFQNKCMAKMEDIGRHGRTVFFVSHSMGALRTLCRRGIVLEHGRVVKDAAIDDAVEHYLDLLEAGAECRVSDRKDRQGAGNLRMTDVEISDGNGGPPFVLATGRAARFVFRVDREAPALECMFRLFNHQGQLLANFDSRVHSNEDLREASRTSRIVCQLDELPLMPGRYRIDASVASNGVWEDGLEGAAYFTVVNGDLRGRPTAHNRKPASICLPHRWLVPDANGSGRTP